MSQVRGLKWVDKGDKGERLVSVALDGRILEWSTKKGLEANQLMKLRPVTEPEGVLKQQLGGEFTFRRSVRINEFFERTSRFM